MHAKLIDAPALLMHLGEGRTVISFESYNWLLTRLVCYISSYLAMSAPTGHCLSSDPGTVLRVT